MRKVSLLLIGALLSLGVVKAQNEMDAYKFSKNDLTGTARSVSMGGAFGALGGDISGVAINPAGIGVYKNSEIVTTLNFQNTATQTDFTAGRLDEKKFKFNFDNLAFVSVFDLNNDVAPSLNVGFSYNRLKNFDRKYSMKGDGLKRAFTDYMAERATRNGVAGSTIDLFDTNNDMWDIWDRNDWLSVLGYNSGMIDDAASKGEYTTPTDGLYAANNLFVEEKGSVSSYDFNIGTTFSDIVSIGATVSLTDINYRINSIYTEEFEDNRGYWGGYDLKNWSRTDGAGWQVKAGVIIKPVQEFRIGLSYHSPTWYNMTDHFAADIDFEHVDTNVNSSIRSYDEQEDAVLDYQLRTPDKWTVSMAGVIGKKAIISADYELTNYRNMKLKQDNGNEFGYSPNANMKNHFKSSSTVRVGLEYRITDQFSARVGYAWMQSPINSNFKNNRGNVSLGEAFNDEVTTDGRPVTNYTLDGDTHHITYGLGYRFSRNFYTDIAFVMKSEKADLYAFDGSEKATLKHTNFQGLLTLGYKF